VRTVKELEQAALTLRARVLNESKDPLEAVFHVTEEEYALIAMQPLSYVCSTPERDRFCGLELKRV
jgi:hypothetical protein